MTKNKVFLINNHPLDNILIPFVKKMKYCGANILDNSPKWLILWIPLFILSVLWLVTLAVSINYLEDIKDLGYIITGMGAQSLNVLHLFLLKIHAKQYLALFKTIREKFWIEKNAPPKRENQYSLLIKLANLYLYGTAGVVLIFILFPLFQIVINNERNLPFPVAKPEIVYYSPYYEIVYMLQAISMYFGSVYGNVVSDIVFFCCVGFSLIQIDIIKERINGLLDGNYDEKETLKKLFELGKHHNTILRFLGEVNSVFKYSLLVRYVFGGTSLLGTGYMFLIEETAHFTTPFFFVTLAGQILVMNTFGEIVTTQCESVGKIAYNIKWQNKINSKIVLGLQLIILRTQKPFEISVGGLINLSLSNYVQFIRALFSYYIVIKKFIDSDN